MSDIAVTGANPVQRITSQPDGVQESGPGAGVSAAVAAGVVPDAVVQGYEAITQSLVKFFPTLTGDQIDILIAEATLKLKEVVGKTEVNELQAKEEQKRQNAAEQRAAAEDAQKALEEAQAAEKKAKKGGLFGKIFGGIAAVMSIVVGAALIATGAGAPLGAALIVSGTASALMLVDQIMMEKTGSGLSSTMLKVAVQIVEILPGVDINDEKVAALGEKLDNAFKWVMIAVMVASAVVSLGVGVSAMMSSATATATASAGAGGQALNVVEKGSTTWNTVNKIATGVTAVATAGSGSATIATAKFSYDASNQQADARETQADVLRARALNDLLDDFIDQILARVSGTNSQFNAMLDDVMASIKDRGDTLARAKFSG